MEEYKLKILKERNQDFDTIWKAAQEEIHLNGWQGKDVVEFIKSDDMWTVITHRKSGENGVVKTEKHEIPKVNVINLWNLIKENTQTTNQLTSKSKRT